MMLSDQAAWIRENAWTPAMRKTHTEVPGFRTNCSCQWGLTSWCQHDQHGRCHRATPHPTYATLICGRGGERPLTFAEPYEHKTPSITGAYYEYGAMVWLADRICRWICPCHCHAAPAAPAQLGLFAEVN